jgi:hypothetical protein
VCDTEPLNPSIVQTHFRQSSNNVNTNVTVMPPMPVAPAPNIQQTVVFQLPPGTIIPGVTPNELGVTPKATPAVTPHPSPTPVRAMKVENLDLEDPPPPY